MGYLDTTYALVKNERKKERKERKERKKKEGRIIRVEFHTQGWELS